MNSWIPSLLFRILHADEAWTLSSSLEGYVLELKDRQVPIPFASVQQPIVTHRLLTSEVQLSYSNASEPFTLKGLWPSDAQNLIDDINTRLARREHDQAVRAAIEGLERMADTALAWRQQVDRLVGQRLQTRGWLGREFIRYLEEQKPALGFDLELPEIRRHLDALPSETQRAFLSLNRPFSAEADSLNRQHMESQRAQHAAFFFQVEKSPLTPEQIDAVLCFEDRMLLVAAAGSGKTSVMVAKAAYALKQGYFTPSDILMLAFNREAAHELGERLDARLNSLGICTQISSGHFATQSSSPQPPSGQAPSRQRIATQTFHAFGLEVIGAATGHKPSVPAWSLNGKDLETLRGIVDDLRSTDPAFQANWGLFTTTLAEDVWALEQGQRGLDAYNRPLATPEFWTLKNEVVKSEGELILANWLFYHGVDYVYERPYPQNTATATHRQYHPDFYFPDINVYLEHWALDEEGRPPPEFADYAESMAWKRQLHRQQGTQLLETTMADIWNGHAFTYLKQELTQRGLSLHLNPDRAHSGRPTLADGQLIKTFRTLLIHTKSNRLGMTDLRQRLNAGRAGPFRFRYEVQLQLFEKIWAAWDAKLRQEQAIDFEDMLNQAADHIAHRTWHNPYKLVMVDEFQDVSQARARMIQALVSRDDSCLFAVGDDWQSINRFAGADMSVMTAFEQLFGPSETLKLETTFRCTQSLCDLSSHFIQKNSLQLRKTVRSPYTHPRPVLNIYRVPQSAMLQSAVAQAIDAIVAQETESPHPIRIFVLGRYRNDRQYIPNILNIPSRCTVEFITAHGSKGLEADHVILPNLIKGAHGFPCAIEDDPILQLAMPEQETYEYAEERRLFYVALTRTRKTVTLITVQGQESPFIQELSKDQKIKIFNILGATSLDEACPTCKTGTLITKKGKYGLFIACDQFPKCRYTRNLSST